MNGRAVGLVTHEGGSAVGASAEKLLERAVSCCMLWEDSFYEDGQEIAKRIESYVGYVEPQKCVEIAVRCREKMLLRHAPLLIAVAMLKFPAHRKLVRELLPKIIWRPSEMLETLAIYWKDGKRPIAAQLKNALRDTFGKFNEYQFAKTPDNKAIKLRDLMRLVHPKPESGKEVLYKNIIAGTLPPADTWEVALSAGNDKKHTWNRLIAEGKLGALALFRNLRNMIEADVDHDVIRKAILDADVSKLIPFQMISAAIHAPQFEPQIEQLMFSRLGEMRKLKGKTILLVDVSGSMSSPISDKSERRRCDVAASMAMICRELCEDGYIFIFNDRMGSVPPRRGFALRDLICGTINGGTFLGGALEALRKMFRGKEVARTIVVTDEQSADVVGPPLGLGYMIDVAGYQNGVGYGKWTRISGWSDSVFEFITKLESDHESLV